MLTTPTTTFSPLPTARPFWGRAAVTGGAGFVGSHLCERLLHSGIDVDCVDDLTWGSVANIAHLTGRPGFRFVACDIARPESREALTGPYDVVLHFAGPASPADGRGRALETLDACGAGTRNALAVADRDGARFLLGSCCQVYGDPAVHPQREDHWGDVDPVGPHSAYDESKRFAEALTTAHVSARGTDAGIVRVFNTYGPRMPADGRQAVPTFIRQALAGEPVTIEGDGRQTRSLCYVDDTVDGILRVAASRSVRPVNIGGEEETTVEEIARRVIALTGSDSRPTFVDRDPGDPARRRPDTTLARELFGWVPKVTWEEGLKRTIAAFADPAPGGVACRGGPL
ncbi:NAD-dependent epimerase/dehydratase family protein [Streptomyces sp. NPDC001848]|uniref:NAD-dependent epimerase/dehydratase family protein n=1 Tax=Streptomyces sp. NPDC001848 TaxID=3364618 RepID=UPI0036D03F63